MIKLVLLTVLLFNGCSSASKSDATTVLDAKSEVDQITLAVVSYTDDVNPYEVKELAAVLADLVLVNMDDKDDQFLKDVKKLEFDWSELKYKNKYITSVDAV